MRPGSSRWLRCGLQRLAKQLGTSHALAGDLWASRCYEARLLAAFVDDPERVTRRQMNAWARDFDNWATCDTACFKLFDRAPHAWEQAQRWAVSPKEFVKRAGFALMASLAGHDKTASDARFIALLPLIERGAADGAVHSRQSLPGMIRRMNSSNKGTVNAVSPWLGLQMTPLEMSWLLIGPSAVT